MQKLLINHGWEFCLAREGEKPEDYSPVDIPHDWLIYDSKNLYKNGDGYYRYKLSVAQPQLNYLLRFEGVYQDCTVFLNGMEIFCWKYGYTTFDVPLLGIKPGVNTIEVRVLHRHPNSRWYSGAGIYRNVWLYIKEDSEIILDGVYVTPKKTDDGFFTEIDTEVKTKEKAALLHSIIKDGEEIISKKINFTGSGSPEIISDRLDEFAPELWSPERPNLYTLITRLCVFDEKTGAWRTVDEAEQKIGYKTLEFTQNRGLILNGSPYKLNGTCIHHDCGALGSAFNINAVRRQFKILKDMGINSLRTSHNPPAPQFLDLCDEMGFLVVNECFDMWERPKNKYDYHRFFPKWHGKDVRSWVRRDRSRACMLMWSIGNEISDTGFLPRGAEITKELKELVRLYDYKNMYPVTLGSNTMYTEGGQECAKLLDVVGYNYGERLYDEHHAKYPDWIIYGSETSSTYQSRGVYHFPAATVTSTYDDEQCSSLLNCATSYGAINSEWNITIDRSKEYSLGQFIWTAIDYIGEPTPYHTKNSHFGHVDTAGFPKDTFYAYKAEWNLNGNQFVHIYPYWDWNEGQLIDIFIFSNCYESELWVNGKCMGRHKHDHKGFGKLSGRWQVPYHKGSIKAIGYDENGNKVAEAERFSFLDPAEITLTPDKTELYADGEDLIFVEIGVSDSNGHPVENARNRVEIEVSGAGRLIGLDNGDSTDYDQYRGTSRRLFNGKLMAIVAAKDIPGEIAFKARSRGLPEKTLILSALEHDGYTACCADENIKSEFSDEIPVRRIDLKVSSQLLTPECNTVTAKAKLFPENTTFCLDDIMFKVTSDAGVVTNLSKVEFSGGKAVVKAVGDGSYRLRAYCKNGTPFDAVISEIELINQGFGAASFDPYSEIVSASLCSSSSKTLQVVMQGGLLTPKGESYIQFDGVDFKKYGSDELTVGIFSYSSEPIPFDICDENGKVIESLVYQAQSQWNTYQYNTFRLKEPIRGLKNIRFSFHESLRFEGFIFKKIHTIGSFLPASARDRVFGDMFKETPDGIFNIGNNVTVIFEDILLETDAHGIEIKGKTRNVSESIRIVIDSSSGQTVRSVLFSGGEPHSEKYEFNIKEDKISVTLLYLPGCDFDLEGITIL